MASDSAVEPARSCARRSAPRIEKQPQQVDRSRVRGGDEQRRPLRLRARIHIGAVCDEKPDLVHVGHGPQQRGGASRADPIRVGAVFEQDVHHLGVRKHGGGHQRRDAVSIDGVGVGAGAKQPLDVTDRSPLDRRKERAAGGIGLGPHDGRPQRAAATTANIATSDSRQNIMVGLPFAPSKGSSLPLEYQSMEWNSSAILAAD